MKVCEGCELQNSLAAAKSLHLSRLLIGEKMQGRKAGRGLERHVRQLRTLHIPLEVAKRRYVVPNGITSVVNKDSACHGMFS